MRSKLIFCGVLFLAFFFITNEKSEPTFKTYTVKKGRHFSFPRVLSFDRKVEKVRWDVIFANNADYLIAKNGKTNIDQKDWNKLCGVFYNLLNTRDETAMIGWRYNQETCLIELAPYYHIDGSRDMFPPMMEVQRLESFSVELSIDRKVKKYKWKLQKLDFETTHEMPFIHSRKTNGYINFYFGGNQKAPQQVSCQMKRTVWK